MVTPIDNPAKFYRRRTYKTIFDGPKFSIICSDRECFCEEDGEYCGYGNQFDLLMNGCHLLRFGNHFFKG